MKYLIASITAFLLLIGLSLYLNSRPDYFGTVFEDSNLWLKSDNSNVQYISTYEKFTKVAEIYDFYTDGVRFAQIQFADQNNELKSIDILENLVGKSIYSVKTVNGKQEIKLLNRAEVIKAISEWRTEYTFHVIRHLMSNSYKVTSLYINEPS